jgi:hypothetical protein
VAVLVVVLGGMVLLVNRAERRLLEPFMHIKAGMTRADVAALFNAPPRALFGPCGPKTKSWMLPNGQAEVRFNPSGVVETKRLCPAKRTVLQRLRRLVDAGYDVEAGPDPADASVAELVEDFLEYLKDGHPDGAYTLTSSAFQERQDLPGFRRYMERFPVLVTKTRRWSAAGGILPGSTSDAYLTLSNWTYTVSNENGSIDVRLIVIREGADWRIDGITVP